MEGADDVGLDKVFRAVDGTVDMRFGSEIDDRARLMFSQQFGDQSAVADVALDEDMATVTLEAGEVLQIAGVSEFVEVDDRFVMQFSQSSTKFAPMKPAPPVTRIMFSPLLSVGCAMRTDQR